MNLDTSYTTFDYYDFNKLVEKTYDKFYCFQQQDNGRKHGVYTFEIPVKSPFNYQNISIPEIVNHSEIGVDFYTWLQRDIHKPLKDVKYTTDFNKSLGLRLWWDRNFFPSIDMIINDLYKNGILPEGFLKIIID